MPVFQVYVQHYTSDTLNLNVTLKRSFGRGEANETRLIHESFF